MPGPLSRAEFHDAPHLAAFKAPGGFYAATLAGALTLDATYPNKLKLNPGGAHRDVTLDAEPTSNGLTRHIVNAATAAENLVVKDDSPATIATINQNEEGEFYCNGTTWVLVAIRTIALS